jgi:non-homologous end joining protein Ku
MTIQFNTDKTVNGDEAFAAQFIKQIEDKLEFLSSQITRIEVHVSDENGRKDGQNDIRCLIEARLEGKQPLAVTKQEDTIEQAVTGALEKLKAALETIIDQASNQHH